MISPSDAGGSGFNPQRGTTAPVTETKEWLAVRERYRLYLRAVRANSKETIKSNSANISFFARWCASEGEPLVMASRDAVMRYIDWNRENHSSSTAANRMLACRSFFRWAVSEGLREDEPTAGMAPKRGKSQARRAYDDAELRALLRACTSQRDRAMIFLLLATGLRRGEFVALTTDDIDWASGTINVRHGKGDRQRHVAVNPAIISELRAYVGDRKGPIWCSPLRMGSDWTPGAVGRPMTGHQVYTRIRQLGEKAGVADAGAHRFRNTYATRFLKDGGDAGALQAMMGHSDVAQTLHYAEQAQAERALVIQRRQRFAGMIAGQAEEEDDATQQQEVVLKADAGRAHYGLAAEQIKLVRLLAQGLTPVELAQALGIADSGARERTKTLLKRMAASTVLEACVKAAKAGLLEDDSEEASKSSDDTAEEPEEKRPQRKQPATGRLPRSQKARRKGLRVIE